MAIGSLRNLVGKNKDALIEGGGAALLTLATGGSKAQAAVLGLGQALSSKLLGPLSLVAGLALGATRSIYTLTKSFGALGTGAARNLETVQNQLRVMLKGLDAAKQRVKEIKAFSVSSPFRMGDIVQGDRALQSLTKGALNSKEGLTQVGDAAAQAGTQFNDMAVYVGRLYDGLSAGRPVGEVLFRLAELGVISGTARNAIEQLQESGAGFGEVWRVVESELAKSRGTMDYTSKTLAGMEEALEDTKESIQATFSANFIEGQKKAIEANIQTLENLRPAVEGLGSAYGSVVSVTSTLQAQFLAMITGLPGMAKGLEIAGRFVGILTAGLTALSVSVGLVGLTRLVVTSGLATRALGLLAGAVGMTRVAFLSVAGVVGGISIALAAIAAVFLQQRAATAAAAQALREYNGTTDATIARLNAQAEAIRTLDALQQNYHQTLREITRAYEDYQTALGDDDKGMQQAALKRIEALKKVADTLKQVDPNTLQVPQEVLDRRLAQKGQDADVETQRRENARGRLNESQGEQLIRSLLDEAALLATQRGQAEATNNGILAFQQEKTKRGMNVMDAGAAVQAQESAIAGFRAERMRMAQADPELAKNGSPEALAQLQKMQAELEKLKQKEAEALLAELKLAEGFKNQVVQIQAGLSVYERYQAAVQGVMEARVAYSEALKTEGSDTEAAAAALKTREEDLARLKKVYDELGWSAQDAQAKQAELAVIKARVDKDLMNRPEEEAAKQRAFEARKAETAKQARLMQERGNEMAEGMMLRVQALRTGGRGREARDLEEEANRLRDLQSRASRIEELKGLGMGASEAEQQAEREVKQRALGRGLDREGGLMQALLGQRSVTDSLARIGGGGTAYGGGDVRKVTDRLDRLIKAVESQGREDLRLR